MLNIIPVPAFNDNYLWLFHADASTSACIVDPGDARPVLKALDAHGLDLEAILITHHHADHIGGVNELLKAKQVPVYGPKSSKIPQVTNVLEQGDRIEVLGVHFDILEIPGHTLDHIAYYAAAPVDDGHPLLFCGDTLFAGGCGRVFEGTHEMMYDSLCKLSTLAPDTRVYCAHEYTLANLKFALAVTPDHKDLNQRFNSEQEKRRLNEPTVPTTIQRELSTNPFLRCQDKDLRESAQSHAHRRLEKPAQVFGVIREWKDNF